MTQSREPTELELAAMAYFDGQLADDELRAFEERLRSDADLARAVAEYRSLDFALKTAAPSEPIDQEWERQRNDPVQRFLLHGSIAFGALGLALLLVAFLAEVTNGASDAWAGLGFGLLLLAAALLIGRGIRGRLHELPFDPYVHVKR